MWDPVDGCADSMVAERRAKAFTAGTVNGAVRRAGGQAARFYAAEAAKVLQAFFHAAALTGRTLEDVLVWVANPRAAEQPRRSCAPTRTQPRSGTGCCTGRCTAIDRTAGNTITTVQQAMALFFQRDPRPVHPAPGRPATDLADLIARRGTVYLLGRDDPTRPRRR